MNEKTSEMYYGFASNLRDALPNVSFIGVNSKGSVVNSKGSGLGS